MTIMGDDRWYQICKLINSAVYTELDDKPSRSSVVPGLVAWDDCSCGLLATTWTIVMASDDFPQEKVSVTGNCEAAWEVMEIVVQLVRCAPSPDNTSLAPTTLSLETAALRMDKDVAQVNRAAMVLLCTMKDDGRIIDFMVNRTSSVGPEGGCVGIEVRMNVALPRINPVIP